ncbi:hypothetical protein [Bradyrhizobium sp. th.b2]|uniref:hypothetical protein n=1 Tax=Bradyrhizobium sp. th-b2 TaxID=172088 RepID=UPI0004288BF1|nr:hypothetical protein [Bradyrhizobium sp. th.b2]
MKLTADRPYANPEKAARRIMEHARAFEPIQDGRNYIEKINWPMIWGAPFRRSAHSKYREKVAIDTALAGYSRRSPSSPARRDEKAAN